MKSLVNKVTEIKKSETEQMTYADLAKVVANRPAEKGFTAEEMRNRLRLLDQIERAKESIEFEDADAQLFKQLCETMPWAVFHKEILAFCDEVKAL